MAKRGRPKKHDHTFLGVFVKVKCPVVETEVMIQLTPEDFSAYESECELCGSHGNIKFDYKCPACNEQHEYELQSW